MTTEPEANETPEVEPAPAPVAQSETPPAVAVERPTRSATDSPILRAGLAIIAAALIFGSGFAVGHWAFGRDNDHHRPQLAARAQNFMQGMRPGRDGQSRNAPQMGQMPNLQQILPMLEQMLNNRNGGGARGSGAGLAGGHGLIGMRERAMAVGGVLTAGPVDGGWQVEATLPYSPATVRVTA
jgi:hypothetical protein